MCGRFAITSRKDRIAERFGVDPGSLNVFDRPRYNIAPSQVCLVIRAVDLGWPVGGPMSWGLLPHWSKSAGDRRYINARSETVFEKPAFRTSAKAQRCLVPADGFYEWKATRTGKVPHFIHLADGQPFGIAGLWDCWERGRERIETFTLLTTTANELMQPIHNRMPVIVKPADYERWLDPAITDPAALADILKPYPAEEMTAYRISPRVNSPRNNDPAITEPFEQA